MTSPTPEAVRLHLVARLRALMARTVANGCTPDEELAAARLVGKVAAQIDGAPPPETAPPKTPWAQTERASSEYQAILEKTTAETLLKAAVQELSLNHINTVSPPRRRIPGQPYERVEIHELLEPHLSMMLSTANTRMGRQILRQVIDELVYEGALPGYLEMPIGR